jgi:2-hydroxy-6-oxonona-2,4-dienedioate hydrolase
VPATRYDQHDIDVLGNRLRYIDVGPIRNQDRQPDRLPIVIMPGHTARIEGFDEMMPILAQDRRVLVVDFPGSGYSAKPDRTYTLEFYEDTLVAFLDAFDIPAAVPVGGSLGGNLVLRLGHRFPDRFPVLALWAPGGAWKANQRAANFMWRFGGRVLFWPSVLVQSRFWYSRDFPGRREALDTTFAYYREVLGPGFVKMYWGIAADQIQNSLFDIAPEIGQRTLLMWGDQDNGAGMGKGVARLHELLPDNELKVFEGARHSLETEVPTDLATKITEFLAHIV